VPTEGRPDLVTKEIINLQWSAKMPEAKEEAAELIMPNLPWAEDHFQERIAGMPTNPGEQYRNWPWWRGQDEVSMSERVGTHSTERDEEGTPTRQFTHTYQERFWPKYAGLAEDMDQHVGIRYPYGDLNDLIGHLSENPLSRQGTFPIFFPEDTGAVHGGRIPCTLHYHFLMRKNKLHLWYPIRSCDAIRHFRDDVYMAVRLTHYVLDRLYEVSDLWRPVEPGYLNFTAYSFHMHKGDMHHE
jgi:thymidylate synthase